MRGTPWVSLCWAGALVMGCHEPTQPGSEPEITAKRGTARHIVMTDLGTLGEDYGYSFAFGINPTGQVVGGSLTDEDDDPAFL